MKRDRIGALHHDQVRDEAWSILALVERSRRWLCRRDVLAAATRSFLLHVLLSHEVSRYVLEDGRAFAFAERRCCAATALRAVFFFVGDVMDHRLAFEL